ncbi:MAG: 3-oxoadipate enol-lactonase [Actinomycetota bacterium]|nr:3-oxoadipate enol-lactonase [Actinomycetota bacterium]
MTTAGRAPGRVRVGGVELAYRDEGPRRAPVLVLTGSLGTTHEMWDEQAEALRGRFRVVRFDTRGHGASGAPAGPWSVADLGGDLLGLLDALGVAHASLCGLSLGGMVALWVASHAPGRVDRLVLACSAPELGPPSPWLERAASVRASGTSSLLSTLTSRWFTPAFAPRGAAVLARVGSMLASCSDEGYASCCEAIASTDLSGDVPSVRAPTLVLAGSSDPVAPPARALALAGSLPDASLTVIAGAAHLANLEQPAAFTAAVRAHLEGDLASAGGSRRRAVLGDSHVTAALARSAPWGDGFQDLVTRYAWGELWGSDALDTRTRSAVTIALLAAGGRREELVLHLAAASRNGLDREEVAEVLRHVAVYAGLPAANAAFSAAGEAWSADAEPGAP